jgi:acetyl esterase
MRKSDTEKVSKAVLHSMLEPTTQKFVNSLNDSTPLYKMTPEKARKVLDELQGGKIFRPKVQIEDRVLTIGPNGNVGIRIFRPENVADKTPVILYFHGAGWVLGGSITHDRLLRELTVGTGATIVFVDYHRAPENRYPIAIEEDYAVLKYLVEHPDEFKIDASRLAIAGDSVGGNMVAVISLLAKERKGPAITAQVLFYPVTDSSMSTQSYHDFANGPFLTKEAMKWFWDSYLPDVEARTDIHVSPLNASLQQLKNLPQALIITDENDVLRDEGEAYAHKLTQAGVMVTSTRYNGTIHDFVMLNPLAETPAARAAINQACDFLKKALF